MAETIEKIKQYKELLDAGLITEDEFAQKKRELLAAEKNDQVKAVPEETTVSKEKTVKDSSKKSGGKYTVRKLCSIVYIVVGLWISLLGVLTGGMLSGYDEGVFLGEFIIIFGLLVVCVGIIQLICSKTISRGKEVFFGIFNLIVLILCLVTGLTLGNLILGVVSLIAAIAFFKK